MGDPSGPGQHRDGDDESGEHVPRHLPSTPPPGRYDLGYGAHPPGGRNGTAVRTPPPPPVADPTARPIAGPAPAGAHGVDAGLRAPTGQPAADTTAAGAGRAWSAAEADTGQMPIVPDPIDAAPRVGGPGAPPHPGPTAPGRTDPTVVGPTHPGPPPPGPIAARTTDPTTAGPSQPGPTGRRTADPTPIEAPLLGPGAPGGVAGFGAGLDRPAVGRRVPVHAQEWPDTVEDAPPNAAHGHRYSDDHGHGYGDGHDVASPPDDHDHRRGVAGSVQGLVGEAAWRYRSAPLRVRILADLAAASLALLLIVGVALALRQDDGPEQATTSTRPQPTTTLSTTTTLPPTTTTLPPTTTTAPTTTTTAPPTTTTAAPVVPPPTEAPTTTVPPTTTTTEAVTYRSCRSAMSAGALPLLAGQPGYGEHLDSDRDGEACDDFEDWGGRG